MENLRTLIQAKKVAKKASLTMKMSRKAGQKHAGTQDQKKLADAPNI